MNDVKLYAPESYWDALPSVREQVCNGCGPGSWKFDLIPDTIWGLSIHDCCDIHDWMYAVGETIADKDSADRTFLNNMLRVIDAAAKESWYHRWLAPLRRHRAKLYYLSVVYFGGIAFWYGKNSKTTMQVVGEH